jgi:polysaccharide pyruvyl transferase WcaK-like protein
MKYFFPIHLDGGNRGCEAIAKGSAILLNENSSCIFGYSRNITLDTKLGINKYMVLIPSQRESYVIDRFLAIINKFFHTKTTRAWRLLYPYRYFLRLINQDDIVISTGGDMLCYDNNEVIYTNNWCYKHGIKTILWGCSMGPENLTKEKLDTLKKFSFIYTRESLTYNYFKSLGLQNICLLPDPAFILSIEKCEMPIVFSSNDVIGINLSNYVLGGMSINSAFAQEVINLINHILIKTDYHILLIPHVTWDGGAVNQDDRMISKIISQHIGQPDRIHVLNIDQLNYCQIRYVISKCKMFIGARTHAVISAYSMCVPTLALGYSIKSRGIAKDLGLSESLVVNCKTFSKGDLLSSFNYLMQNEESIRKQLQRVTPEYKQRTYMIHEYLKKL